MKSGLTIQYFDTHLAEGKLIAPCLSFSSWWCRRLFTHKHNSQI